MAPLLGCNDQEGLNMSAKPYTKPKNPERGAAHERLNVFVGNWHAEGDSYAVGQETDDPRGTIEKWVSDDTVEWLPGKFFVMQRWDAMTGPNEFKGTSIISHDPQTGDYMMRAYENHGFVNDYVTRADGNVWTFTADTNRGRIEFTDGGDTQKITWEWRPDGKTWLPLCDRVAKRVD
jgi:hypothetical protein